MDLLILLGANGIANGSHYALLGLAFGLIFSTTRTVHFAFGSIYMVAAYISWAGMVLLDLPLLPTAILSVLLSAVLGGAVYLLLYRPFERSGSPMLVPLIASLGLVIVMENLTGIVAGTENKVVLDFVNDTYVIELFGTLLVVSVVQIAQVLALVSISLLMWVFLKFTRYGKAIMAMTDDPRMARVVGINTVKISVLVFMIGSAISAVAASIILLKQGGTTHMGFDAVFVAFVAVIVGGVGSLRGAVLGGLLIGLIESIGMIRLSTEWQSTISFIVLFLVLIFRPTGLFRGT